MAKRVQVVLSEDVLSLGKNGDLVEVAPDYDHSGSTAILAAQILLNFIGRIKHNEGCAPQAAP